MRLSVRWASLAVVMMAALPVMALAQPPGPEQSTDQRCQVGIKTLIGPARLPHTAAALAAGHPLTVVALGSSSTQGYGASADDKAYPAQLAGLLRQRFPNLPVTVINKGVGGDNIENMLARLSTDVLALEPQLVIWQTGTNDAIRRLPPAQFRAALFVGMRRLHEKHIDVILMTPQFAPQFTAAPDYDLYLNVMREAGHRGEVPVFRRFSLSQLWSSDHRFAGIPVIAPDGLHPTDAAYRCTAVLLADSIARLAGGH